MDRLRTFQKIKIKLSEISVGFNLKKNNNKNDNWSDFSVDLFKNLVNASASALLPILKLSSFDLFNNFRSNGRGPFIIIFLRIEF